MVFLKLFNKKNFLGLFVQRKKIDMKNFTLLYVFFFLTQLAAY